MIWLGRWPADVSVAWSDCARWPATHLGPPSPSPGGSLLPVEQDLQGGEDAGAGRGAVFAAAFRGALTAGAQGPSATLITVLQVSRVCFVSEQELLHRVSGPRIQLTGSILLQKMPEEIDLPSLGYSIRCNISFCTSDVPS